MKPGKGETVREREERREGTKGWKRDERKWRIVRFGQDRGGRISRRMKKE